MAPILDAYNEKVIKFSTELKDACTSGVDSGLFELLNQHIPEIKDRDNFVKMLEILGDEFQRERVRILERNVALAVNFIDVIQWWRLGDTKKLNDDSIVRMRPIRLSLKEMSHVNEDKLNNVYGMREGGIELYWPADVEKQKEFITMTLYSSNLLTSEIYEDWRNNLDSTLIATKSGIPNWRDKPDLTQEPIRSDLLLNPHYGDLAKWSAELNSFIEVTKRLHADGGNIVISPVKMAEATRVKGDAIDTVSVTFTVFQLTVTLAKLEKEEKKNAAKQLVDSIRDKGYTMPPHLENMLDEIIKT
jgi:hypothetical protein